MIKIFRCWETTCGDLKTFFSTFILAHIQIFIVQLNKVVLTLKAPFILFIRTIKIKKTRSSREEPTKFQIERQNSFENELKPVKINSDEETTGRQKKKKKTWASWKKQGAEKEKKKSWKRKSGWNWTLETVKKRVKWVSKDRAKNVKNVKNSSKIIL